MTTTIKFDRLPGSSRLFLDYLYDPHHVGAFFAWPFHSDREFEACARLLNDYQIDRAEIAEILKRQNTEFQADDAAMRNIDRLRQSNADRVYRPTGGFVRRTAVYLL